VSDPSESADTSFVDLDLALDDFEIRLCALDFALPVMRFDSVSSGGIPFCKLTATNSVTDPSAFDQFAPFLTKALVIDGISLHTASRVSKKSVLLKALFSKNSRTYASTLGRTASIKSQTSESRAFRSACITPSPGSRPIVSAAIRASASRIE
jgi:hypothetical protein